MVTEISGTHFEKIIFIVKRRRDTVFSVSQQEKCHWENEYATFLSILGTSFVNIMEKKMRKCILFEADRTPTKYTFYCFALHRELLSINCRVDKYHFSISMFRFHKAIKDSWCQRCDVYSCFQVLFS